MFDADRKTGVLLINTGTPKSPEVSDVRRYLRQFLSDPRVLDMAPLARWLLLELVILPFRPAKSAKAYRAIWTERGSPLLFHGLDLVAVLQAQLGDRAVVRLAMQFGTPTIPAAFTDFAAQGVDNIVIVPLFPQYAAASFGSAVEATMAEAATRWVTPNIAVIPPFFDQPEFIAALASHVAKVVDREVPDHFVFSYHGLPERHCQRTDTTGQHCLKSSGCCDELNQANRNCYRAQCFATSRLLINALQLSPDQVTTSFQSRLGRIPWIKPHTDIILTQLGEKKLRKIVVVEPSFVADCLETLEEIGIRGRDDFRAAGGGELVLVPSLNATEPWAIGLAAIIERLFMRKHTQSR